jgi:hypothetical protein
VLLLLGGLNCFSQNYKRNDDNEIQQFSDDSLAIKFNHHHLGLAIGIYKPGSQNSLADSNLDAIPAFQLQYTYWIDPSLGFGLNCNFQWISYALLDTNTSEQKNEIPLTLSLLVHIKIIDELKFFAGPGIKIDSEENHENISLGFLYSFHLGKNWYLSPSVLYDYSNENLQYLGVMIEIALKL